VTQLTTKLSPTTQPTPAPRARRVVYADDMQELRELVQVVLGREGFAVETFANGKSAFNHIAPHAEAIDLVITDHHMPEMNGLELVHRLKAMNYAGKILVFSSELSFEVHARYRDAGVDRVLPKPIFPSQLRQILGELFQP
jgi:two-component system, chemotaxis family, chemotaxis protein CheY